MKNVLSRVIGRISESASIACFGATLFEQARLFCTLLFRNNATVFPIHALLKNNNTVFSLTFRSHADLMLFHEIFCGHPYHVEGALIPEYIVDLGANTGISTLYLHTLYPSAHIAAVEANPELLAQLQETVRSIATISILPYAVTDSDGTREFYVNDKNPLGSSLAERGSERRKIVVEAHSLKFILKEADYPRADLVKFDIEGAEWEVFSVYPSRNEISTIVGEIHEDLMGVKKEDFNALWTDMKLTYIPTKKQYRYVVSGITTRPL